VHDINFYRSHHIFHIRRTLAMSKSTQKKLVSAIAYKKRVALSKESNRMPLALNISQYI